MRANRWRILHKALLPCILMLGLPCFAAAKIEGKRYIHSGSLNMEALQHFQQALKTHPDINELELVGSQGSGDHAGPVVFGFIRAIDRLKMKTFVRQRCFSSCAVIFFSGYGKTMLPGTANDPTVLMLHAARDKDSHEIMPALTRLVNENIVEHSQGKITMEFLDMMNKAKNSHGGIYIASKVHPGRSHVDYWSGDLNENFVEIGKISLADLGIEYDPQTAPPAVTPDP